MNFPALMRIASLEILGAFAVFAVVAARLRPDVLRARRKAVSLRVILHVREAPALGPDREVAVVVGRDDPAVVGRSSQAQVGLTDPEVSRRHARLDLDRGVLYVSDLGSSNGTFLNGKPVDEDGIEVRTGDDIDVGNSRITITRTEPVTWT